MVIALPALSQQLTKVGQTVKSAGPSLFSPSQAPGPTTPQNTSLARDRFDTSLNPRPLSDWSGNNLGQQQMGSLNPRRSSLTSSQNAFSPQQSTSPYFAQNGSVSAIGGDASVLNQYDEAFTRAGAMYGIDPNWLKSVAATERGWEGTSVAGAIGLMQIMPGGYPTLEAMYPNWQTDPVQNIMLGAAILNAKRQEQGGDLNRGTMGYLGFGGADAYGTTADQYLSSVQSYYNQLGGGSASTVQPIGGLWGGNAVGNGIVEIAKQFVGVAYNWGAIPGANQDPWVTGWDCSGMTYYFDQKYGGGQLPMGSHYQYQYAQQTGQLFTDLSMLQPGDLVFIDTGWQGGAGAELNRAGHVAIYIGNGQIIHAANEQTGTIISNLSAYGGVMGAMHMSWGGGGVPGYSGGTHSNPGYSSATTQSIKQFYASYGR